MRFALGIACGIPLGAMIALVTTYGLLRPALRKAPPPRLLHLLPPGGREWTALAQPLEGSCTAVWPLAGGRAGALFTEASAEWRAARSFEWDPRTRAFAPGTAEPPRWLANPRAPDPEQGLTRFALPDGGAIAARDAEGHLVVEPGQALPPFPLPPFPLAADRISQTVQSATRLATGAFLAVLYDRAADRHHGFFLEPGAARWSDLGALDLPASGAADLFPAAGGRALFVSAGGGLAVFEGRSFRVLPEREEKRFGLKAALLDDGSVMAAGGFVDRQAMDLGAAFLLPAAALAAAVVLGILAHRFWQASSPALLLGAVAGVAGVAAGLFVFYALAARH